MSTIPPETLEPAPIAPIRPVARSRRWAIAVVVGVVALIVGAGGGYLVGHTNAPTKTKTVTAAASGSWDEGMHGTWRAADLSAFKAALESGDVATLRALFTPDGVLTTASNIFGLYNGEKGELGQWGVNSDGFAYLATVHGGGTFTIVGTPVEVQASGNAAYDKTAVFGWRWNDGTAGTGLLHFRNGKIVEAILDPSQVSIGQ
jgi:hypothetical protein